MKKNFHKLLNLRGQGLVEYALLVSLLVIGIVLVLNLFGLSVSDVYCNVSKSISGSQEVCTAEKVYCEDTFAEVQVIPTDESKQKVGQQIIDVYTKIRQKKFAPGCGESDCTWCNYLNSGSLLKLHEDVEEIDES